MENASKALLMAGGILIGILLLSLLLYAWNMFSDYQASNVELANIENVSKFNQQFTNYDRDDVEGYEIITLVNQVTDYNNRKSTTGSNDEGYNAITIRIDLSKGNLTQFAKSNENKLFRTNVYDANRLTSDIINPIKLVENNLGGIDSATKIAKSYDSIFIDSTDSNELNKAMEKYNLLTTNKITNTSQLSKTGALSNNVLRYYEYMQFKRGVFRSLSNRLEYDNNTGRVINMEFEWTGKIH